MDAGDDRRRPPIRNRVPPMSDLTTPDSYPCEVVGVIGSEAAFAAAVAALQAAGFERTDLSVLASRDSIDAAGKPASTWRDALVALAGDARYEGALVASGAIFLAGGPLAATLAALIGAAVGGIAVKDVLEELTAKPHTAEFARSLEAGSVILWVRAGSKERYERARDVLIASGAGNVHPTWPIPSSAAQPASAAR
jgi:hypothetical protein